MAEERDLATRLIAGDVDALEQLIERWRGPAERFADSILHDSYAAEDAVQEAFARVWAARTIFDPRYSFSTYLYTIVRRVCIDQIRHEKHEPVPFAEYRRSPLLPRKRYFCSTTQSWNASTGSRNWTRRTEDSCWVPLLKGCRSENWPKNWNCQKYMPAYACTASENG